ncbi:hypothetical protein BGZ83_000718 [Gryganskiella cystojenkinii]|nr:hypothetical protein BGZ83_000718 [Gryganskiella cystojenkinii]
MALRIPTRIYSGSRSRLITFATQSRLEPLSCNPHQLRPCQQQHYYSGTTSSTTPPNAQGQSNLNFTECEDCPELPSTPSWSLESIMDRRDQVPPACPTSAPKDPSRDPITPETINQLIKLAHLRQPSDEKVLHRLQRDVIRMRNFLDYIRDYDLERPHVTGGIKDGQAQAKAVVGNLRSLVDDGRGLQMRASPDADNMEKIVAQAEAFNDDGIDESDEQAKLKRREMLLSRPKKVRGNFFVVATGAETSTST